MVIGSIGLVFWRRDELKSDARLDSLFSREAVFLLQNLLLVALTAVIFWVTFFPLISEAVTGTEVSVGPPAFRPFVVPLALIIVAALRHRPDHRLATGDAGQAPPQLRVPGRRRRGHAARAPVRAGRASTPVRAI